MNKRILVKNIGEISANSSSESEIRNKINCFNINLELIKESFSSPIYVNAFTGILVLSGNGKIRINNISYSISKNSIVLLSVSHSFHFERHSQDFTAISLMVSNEFMDEMDATDMIYKRIKYGARLYNTPVLHLNSENALIIKNKIKAINKAIENTSHFYYKDVILNKLFAFYLELSNMIEKEPEARSDSNSNRYENMIKSFLELLVENYKSEHKVEFYASKLNITSHYLTLIVKRITGQTVNNFIFDMIYSEARNLLTHSRLSIQEIALSLSFSDQSSFGKFFKRKSGVSPIEFRKKLGM